MNFPIHIYIIIGLCAGLIAGFFGVGGGIIIVPALIYFAGFSQLTATGTSLAILLPPVGLAAVMEYYRTGNVDIRAAAVIAVCLFLAAWVSSRFAVKMNPVYLRIGFGLFVVCMGSYILYTGIHQLNK